MPDVLEKQMKKEEALASKEISKAITTALNSKATIKKADEIAGMCGGWPYEPSRDMLKLYGKTSETAWKKLKPKYKSFDVSISVNSPSNRPPVATVDVVFDGEWKGGVCKMVSTGDTIEKMAKKIYGYESYADKVYEANAKALGKSCRTLPAGFGLDFPNIWVPNWKKDPKVCSYPFVKKKAVKVKLPSLQTTVDIVNKTAAVMPIGNVIVFVELEGKAEITGTKKGDMNASFSMKAYESELKKGFGPLEAGFKVGVKGTPSGSLSLNVFNAKIGGLKMSGNVKLLEGAFEVSLGSKPITTVSKGITFTGTITLTAKIRIVPNLRLKPKKVRRRDWEFDVSPKEVAVGVAVVGVIAVGGWAVIAGGAAVEGVGALGAMALAAVW